MEDKAIFQALHTVCEKVQSMVGGQQEDTARRLEVAIVLVQDHARHLEPLVNGFTIIYHHFDFDPQVPANGYRTLVKVVRSCLLHIIQKGRYIASSRESRFFRAEHNVAEIEAYAAALCQLRALLYLAQRLLHDNSHRELVFLKEGGLNQSFIQEYTSLHKACFYGRCLGFQFCPAIRPFLQTVVVSLVSFSKNYRKHHSGIVLAGSSFFTSGKYIIDPELRGADFERITQNLDLEFWKSFWNLTETTVLSSLASMTCDHVEVNHTQTLLPMPFNLPLTSAPQHTVTISPPVAHFGPGPIRIRLISSELREGQGCPISHSFGLQAKLSPLSPWLLVHFHGGGFVAQTSKSHEIYLRTWARDLKVPVLSVDYSLAPEAPFPRALEECFYAYCWAIKNCSLLGSTAERVCLAGDSAGGNLCITVAMRAVSLGVRVPDGIMAAYPAILLTTHASPSRLLTMLDPLLPLGVLSKCLSAYTGMEKTDKKVENASALSMVKRETVLLLNDLTKGASSWIQSLINPYRGISGVSGGTLCPPQSPCQTLPPTPQSLLHKESSHNRGSQCTWSPKTPLARRHKNNSQEQQIPMEYPWGFQPLRSKQLAEISMESSPTAINPYVSPLLAPDSMLKGLPPIHIVASALDSLLDDSVMFARRLRSIEQPVTLSVVEDLPHGFLSLSKVSKETQEASDVCIARIRDVFTGVVPLQNTHKL